MPNWSPIIERMAVRRRNANTERKALTRIYKAANAVTGLNKDNMLSSAEGQVALRTLTARVDQWRVNKR